MGDETHLRLPFCALLARLFFLATIGLAGCGKDEPPAASSQAGAPAAAVAVSGIGTINALEGDVRLFGVRGEERAQAGVRIEQGETVKTMPNAWALLAMSDGASITVRADSEVRFDTYRFDPDAEPQQNSASMQLIKGALRSITGLIGAGNRSGYQIRTETATIGIRGTDHEPAYYPPPPAGQKAEHPPGTYDKVNEGETVIRRPSGEVAVRRGQTAFAPRDVKLRPQVLAQAPAFYQRYAEVDRRVVERRTEFHRQFAEREQRRQEQRRQQQDVQKKDKGADKGHDKDKDRESRNDRKDRKDNRDKRRDDQKKKQDERKAKREDSKKAGGERQEQRKQEREKRQETQDKKQDERKKAREQVRQEQQQQRQQNQQRQQLQRDQQRDQREGQRRQQQQQDSARQQQQERERARQQQQQQQQQERERARQQQQQQRQRQREPR